MKTIKNKIKVLISIIIIILLILFFVYQNNKIVISNYEYSNDKILNEYTDFKIVQISDLHNKMFGKDQRRLIKKIERLNPDIIVITGDLVDSRRYNLNKALKFINSAIDIAPIYYVSGNHEARTRMYTKVKETLEDAGVIILDNTMISINSNIDIIGVPDPDFLDDFFFNSTNTSEIINILEKYCNDEKFQILLAHRPELFSLYSEYNIDLIFSGHAHGGQMRLPFIGGIFAPNQGFFPKFIEGMHVQNKSTMYVSRGLGNSIFPFRIFNKPEIVVVTLKSN